MGQEKGVLKRGFIANESKRCLTLHASAGSGKTFALILRYLSLLFLGFKPYEILVITFTRKATSEVIKRVADALDEIARLQDIQNNPFIRGLCSEYGFNEDYLCLKAQDVRRVFASSSFQIRTIDGFLSLIVQRFCWYMGISKSYRIGEVKKQVLEELFLQNLSEEEYSWLLYSLRNEKKNFKLDTITQYWNLEKMFMQSLKSTLSFCMGNEEFFCEEDKDFLGLLNSKDRLCISEISKLTKILEHKIDALSLDIHEQILVGHKYLEDFRVNKTAIKQFDKCLMHFKEGRLDKVEEFLKIRLIQEGNEHFYLKGKPIPQSYFLEVNRLALMYLRIREARHFTLILGVIRSYREALNQYYKDFGVLGYADVEQKVFEFLTILENRDFFYFRLDSKINHLLMDEAQDTSMRQYEILMPLIEEIRSGGSNFNKSLFFVGDPKQSIYRFRGASMATFHHILSITESENLPFNYRTHKNILDFNNKHFSSIFGKDFILQKIPSDSEKIHGYVKVYDLENEPFLGLDTDFESIDFNSLTNSMEDRGYELVAKSLHTLLQRGVLQEDIAILCHDNKNIFELKKYLMVVLGHLYPDLHILTDRSKRLLDSHQSRVLSYCLKYIMSRESGSKEESEYYRVSVAKMLGRELDCQDFIIPNKEVGLSDYLWLLMNEFDLCDEFAREMLELSFDFEDMDDFLDQLETMESKIQSFNGLSGIKIMTIHASKGLEFEHVIYCPTRSKPNYNSTLFYDEKCAFYCKSDLRELRKRLDIDYQKACEKNEQEFIQEEKNVLYVAFSRSIQSLFIIPSSESKSLACSRNFPPVEVGCIQVKKKDSLPTERMDMIPVIEKDFGREEDFLCEEKVQEHEFVHQGTSKIFGDAIHFCLEQSWFLDDETLRNWMKNLYGFYLDGETLERILSRKNALHKNAEFLNLIDGGKLYTEAVILRGNRMYRMDLLVLYPLENRAVVIDYKSGKILEEYRKQLSVYMQLMQEILPAFQIKGAIVCLFDEPKIEIL